MFKIIEATTYQMAAAYIQNKHT